jgi:hypothetical protein
MPRVRLEKYAVSPDFPTVPEHLFVDGKWVHRIRQSDIKRYEHCPESHRRHLLALDPELNNDSAILGTVFALYPEARLNGENPIEATHETINRLIDMWHSPGLNQVTFDSLDHAIALLSRAMDTWENHILPKVRVDSIPERRFRVKAYEDKERIIILEGTSDLWLPNGEIWDWKFSGRSYIGQHAWKNERYDPQPVHYCLARSIEEKVNCTKFTFVNIRRDDTKGMNKAPEVEWLPVEVTLGDFQFHMNRLYNMATNIERMGFDRPWSLNPTDWWCSSTWCPSWDECRGKFIGHDPWGNLAKRLKNG